MDTTRPTAPFEDFFNPMVVARAHSGSSPHSPKSVFFPNVLGSLYEQQLIIYLELTIFATNDAVLQLAEEQRTLMTTLRQRQK